MCLVRNAAHISAKTKTGPVNSLQNAEQSHANQLFEEKLTIDMSLSPLPTLSNLLHVGWQGCDLLFLDSASSHIHHPVQLPRPGAVKLVVLLLEVFSGFSV